MPRGRSKSRSRSRSKSPAAKKGKGKSKSEAKSSRGKPRRNIADAHVERLVKQGGAGQLTGKRAKKSVRMSEKAKIQAHKAVNRFMGTLGAELKDLLMTAGKKTISIKLMMQCKRITCNEAYSKALKNANRSVIAPGAASRSLGLPLGRGKYSISEDAKNVLSAIAAAYLKKLGAVAAGVANSGGRNTIESRDIMVAIAAC
jgi:histone H3/H4